VTGAEGEVGPPTIVDIIAALEELVSGSRRVPFTGTVAVNDDELLTLLERMRSALPEELVRAHRILDEREQVLTQTEEEAARIRERAEAASRSLAERTQEAARHAAEHVSEEASRQRSQAQAEATRILEEARSRSESMVSEHAVVRAAESRAREVVADAEAEASRLIGDAEDYMRQAEDYVAGVMAELERHLDRVAATVRNGLGTLRQKSGVSGTSQGRRRG
jgi:membrane protein involved in colicin uptake